MKKIEYKVLTPYKATLKYFNTPEFDSNLLNFNYLLREPGQWVKTPLNKGIVYIKELEKNIVTDENGDIKYLLKNGLYHAKIIDFGETDIHEQFQIYSDIDIELAKKYLLKQQRLKEFIVNIGNYYYAEGLWKTKIQEKDIPDYYVSGYEWHMSGVYIKAKDVKSIAYRRSVISPESFKYDLLAISYDKTIEINQDSDWRSFKNYDFTISGCLIINFVKALEVWSPDVPEIGMVSKELVKSSHMHRKISEMQEKQGWEAAEKLKTQYMKKMMKNRSNQIVVRDTKKKGDYNDK